jgi:hypothetical protein
MLGSNAYLAVDFFFMLSGYVMARTYEARLEAVRMLATMRFVGARLAPDVANAVLLGSSAGGYPGCCQQTPAQAMSGRRLPPTCCCCPMRSITAGCSC